MKKNKDNTRNSKSLHDENEVHIGVRRVVMLFKLVSPTARSHFTPVAWSLNLQAKLNLLNPDLGAFSRRVSAVKIWQSSTTP